MKSTWLRMAVVSPIALAVVSGCRAPAPEPYATWIERQTPYRPSDSSENAFDAYVLAANEAETANPAWLKRVWFTPGMRRQVEARLRRSIDRVEAATRREFRFEFRPTGLGEPAPYRAGWRLLGRALVWRVEDAVAFKDYDRALRRFQAATKFGFDLTGGSAEDASLGFAIVDEARRALLPALPSLTARQLDLLSGQLARLEGARPPLEQTIRNEGKNMLASVEAIQDSYRRREFKSMETLLGAAAEPGIRALQRLPEGPQRAAYFRGFAEEAGRETAYVLEQSARPTGQRGDRPEDGRPRPWARLARHVFGGALPTLAIADRSIARTRLLALHAWALARLRQTGQAPRTLSATTSMKTDPYSGRALSYRAMGSEFVVYSVGSDIRDDGGESDASGIEPDLTLEPVE